MWWRCLATKNGGECLASLPSTRPREGACVGIRSSFVVVRVAIAAATPPNSKHRPVLLDTPATAALRLVYSKSAHYVKTQCRTDARQRRIAATTRHNL